MPGYWGKVAQFPPPYDSAGSSYGLSFNNKAYFSVVGALLEWDGISINATVVADPAGGALGMSDLIVHSNEIYASGQDGHLYKWNGLSPSVANGGSGAWTDLAVNADGNRLYSITSHDGRLFVGTNGNGRLWEYTGGSLVARSPGNSFSQTELHFLLSYDTKLWASSAFDNLLLEWDEGAADFINRTTSNPTGIDAQYCVTIDSDDYGNLYGGWKSGTSQPRLLKWNNVDAWETVAEPPSGITGIIHFILWDPDRRKMFGILENNGILLSYDPITEIVRVEATEAGGTGYRSLMLLDDNIYSVGDGGVYRFYEVIQPPELPPAEEADIRLFPGINGSDIAVGNKDLVRDSGLETAVYITLFTDMRASEDDPMPDNSIDKRGWWSDNSLGSKLWLLRREKTIDAVLARAEQYAESALQWLLDDGIADEVLVTAERISMQELELTIQISQPDGEPVFYRYYYNWEAQISRRA